MTQSPAISVSDAVHTRRAVREFLDTPVDIDLIRAILVRAARAPSAGNIQPWHIHVLHGDRIARLKTLMTERVAMAPDGEGLEYPFYPENMDPHFFQRLFNLGDQLYGALGIARDDEVGRKRWFTQNYQFFGAPVGLFCHVPRVFGRSQWADLGMYLQTVMLLLREAGLDSCPQESWAHYHKTVSQFIEMPDSHMLYCGMAIGYGDHDASPHSFRTVRVPPDDFLTIDPAFV